MQTARLQQCAAVRVMPRHEAPTLWEAGSILVLCVRSVWSGHSMTGVRNQESSCNYRRVMHVTGICRHACWQLCGTETKASQQLGRSPWHSPDRLRSALAGLCAHPGRPAPSLTPYTIVFTDRIAGLVVACTRSSQLLECQSLGCWSLC